MITLFKKSLVTVMMALSLLTTLTVSACPGGPKGARCGLPATPTVDLLSLVGQRVPGRDLSSIAANVARLELIGSPDKRGYVTVRVHFSQPYQQRVLCCMAIGCNCPPFVLQHHVDLTVSLSRGRFWLQLRPGMRLYVAVL